ncbi:hypothetical protein [Vibrio ishigakensis]|uniref:hypothetical protein n=1 Tax=Vibrio ishigakensis TaxID=1481914 RepID=UPI0021C3B2F1|nr:hypothetical protein [Vibrio ishigakensis]
MLQVADLRLMVGCLILFVMLWVGNQKGKSKKSGVMPEDMECLSGIFSYNRIKDPGYLHTQIPLGRHELTPNSWTTNY